IPPNAGIGYVEKKAFATASYGKQLGLIMEVLLPLAKSDTVKKDTSQQSLKELEKVYQDIEEVKKETRGEKREALIAQLKRLRDTDPNSFQIISEWVSSNAPPTSRA